jgi:hypothetical protein
MTPVSLLKNLHPKVKQWFSKSMKCGTISKKVPKAVDLEGF